MSTTNAGFSQQSTINGGYIDLHELAKGWKASIARVTDPSTRHEATIKNDRGNLPLHTAASFRAPMEVTEALLEAFPEAAGMTNNYGNLALHFTAWKKGPLDVERLLLKVFPEGAAQKNNHGNLPLHYAAHYNAPLEVVEALYNAYPEGALQKNNDSNTPLDLAIADGASPNVVALLQGKAVPPGDDEVLEQTRGRHERLEKELQSHMSRHDSVQGDLSAVLELLSDIKERHPHALYNAGIKPDEVRDLDSLLDQVRKAGDDMNERGGEDEAMGGGSNFNIMDNGVVVASDENQDDSLIPADDEVEHQLSKIVGLDAVKNQVRGMRRTIEISRGTSDRQLPAHFALVGGPGTGKTFTARILMQIMHKIGAVRNDVCLEVGRNELLGKTEKKTIEKTKLILEKAKGGVLFVDEAHTLLPSPARRGAGRGDYGEVVLRTIAETLSENDPLVILTGYASDLQVVMASNSLGFKEHFLLTVELPNPTPYELAHMFMTKARSKGLVFAQGINIDYVAELIQNNTKEEWTIERNGRVADLLLNAVRTTMKRREGISQGGYGGVDARSVPSPANHSFPCSSPEAIIVTVEDLQNALVRGL